MKIISTDYKNIHKIIYTNLATPKPKTKQNKTCHQITHKGWHAIKQDDKPID